MQFSGNSFALVRVDGELIRSCAHAKRREQPSVLLPVPAASRPNPETPEKTGREHSMRYEPEFAWPARRKATSRRDPESALNQHVSESMEIRHFLKAAAGFANSEVPESIAGTAPCPLIPSLNTKPLAAGSSRECDNRPH